MTLDFAAEKLRYSLKYLIRTLNLPTQSCTQWSAALLNSKAELLHADGSPLSVTAYSACAQSFLKYFSFKPGEILITNDPSSGNTRLSDVVLAQGAFHGSELRYIIVIQATLPELLNIDWKEIPHNLDHEGLRIPPSPLFDNSGSINQALVDYIGSTGLSKERLANFFEEVVQKFQIARNEIMHIENNLGRDRTTKHLKSLQEYSEERVRHALSRIPDGQYTAHDNLESDGVNKTGSLKIQGRLSVHGENISIQFHGTHKQVSGPYNLTYSLTLAACIWFVRSLVDEDIPMNAGFLKAFAVEAPEGTLVNAKGNVSTIGGYFETSHRLIEVLKLCYSHAQPSHAMAQAGGTSVPLLIRFENNFLLETLGVGDGASKNREGLSAIQSCFTNRPALSVEEIEHRYPIQVIQCTLRDSSGGAGKYNGGSGLNRGFRFLKPAKILFLCDRMHLKALGQHGGLTGLPTELVLSLAGVRNKSHDEKKIVQFAQGDTLIVSTAGGGAWGKEDPTPTL